MRNYENIHSNRVKFTVPYKSKLSLRILSTQVLQQSSRKILRIKVTPDLHLTYSKNGGNLGLVLKMKNIACISVLLTKHVKYTYLYLFQFVLSVL